MALRCRLTRGRVMGVNAMSFGRIKKIEGGSGGKRGHSNMTHWEFTEVIKHQAKKKRRIQSKKIIAEETK